MQILKHLQERETVLFENLLFPTAINNCFYFIPNFSQLFSGLRSNHQSLLYIVFTPGSISSNKKRVLFFLNHKFIFASSNLLKVT